MSISSSEINKLVCVQQSLEKSTWAIIERLKRFPNYEDISKLPSIQEQERQTERNQLQVNIKEITDHIKSKIYFLGQNKTLDNADLKQFKSEMILIQDSIQNLLKNSKAKIKILQIDYIDINQDVDYYEEKIFEWSEPVNLTSNVNYKNYTPCNSKLKCVEMREFIEFVRRSGGHENNWDKDDHHIFLKYRNKYKDIEVVAKKVNELLPDKDIAEIKQHEEWYKKYLVLKNNKKDAIRRWQDSKSKTKAYSPVTDENNCPHQSKTFHFDEDLKEKLTKWKQEKEIKFQLTLDIEQSINQQRRELEILRKKKNIEVKKIVEDWKKTKISLKEKELMRKKIQEESEKKRRATEANRLIRQYQSQDDFYILKLQQQKKSLQNSKPLRSKSSQLAVRDPERLLKPTQQWINRVRDENIYPVESVIPLKKLPKLGIPEWRKNI